MGSRIGAIVRVLSARLSAATIIPADNPGGMRGLRMPRPKDQSQLNDSAADVGALRTQCRKSARLTRRSTLFAVDDVPDAAHSNDCFLCASCEKSLGKSAEAPFH